MRSVDGTTQATKTASLERGMEAAFVFATADRAAAMLKVGVHTSYVMQVETCHCTLLLLRILVWHRISTL